MPTHPAAPTIDLPLVRRGKVREVYELPPSLRGTGVSPVHKLDEEPRLLMVASDRISAFDVVMPTPITGKGRLLTEIAAWWFDFLSQRKIVESHILSTDVDALDLPLTAEAREYLRGRSTICRRCGVVPIECVVRGYLEGSGWKEYRQTGAVSGVRLPAGLRQCDKLPEPIFTPATKAAEGHDENVSFEQAAESLGENGLETMGYLRDVSLKIYKAAAEHALARGIIIADTKFEFGFPEGTDDRSGRVWTPPILIDEALTPDSSRFWPADSYEPGHAQKSFDKQFLREYLETLVESGSWNKTPPGPELPASVVEGTLARYREARDRLCS